MKAISLLAAAALAGMLALSGSAAGRASALAAPKVELKVSPPAFSPNADSVKDTLRATIRVDQAVTLTIEIVSEQGVVAFTDAPGVLVQPGPVRFSWNGRKGGTGHIAKDGHFTLRATVVDAAGGRSVAETRILLDTKPPVMIWGELSPTVLQQGPLTLRFRLADLATRVQLKLGLLGQSGNSVRTGAGSSAVPGPVELRWPRTHGARLAPGSYRISLEGTDEAGNSSTSAARSFLVDRSVRARVYGRFRGVGRRIALTFDDCNFGGAWTSILNTLARYKIKGTFFCPGRQVLANPEIARRTVHDGHAIGSHGWDHANFGALSFGSAERRLDLDRDVWWKLARVAPTPYFRPPYGAYTATTMAAAGRAGYSAVVLWDVDPRDWSRPGSAAIENRILTHVRPGSIVLMHVINQTAAQLPSLIHRLLGRRFVPVTLPELDRIGRATPGHWPPNSSATSGA
ncbi:MAG TPA: polysaccharide deacetylase family protein [Gaiellaceae bacterium]